MYGARGWTAHHNADLWRHSGMVGDWGNGDPVWATWAMAGPWLAQHLYEHYLYGGDLAWLRDKAYPALRGAAEFGLDWLVDDGKGHLVTAPSTSPENQFRARRPARRDLGRRDDGSALMRDLFSSTADAAEALGIDAPFRKQLLDARAKLRPYAIGSKGQLLEWSRGVRGGRAAPPPLLAPVRPPPGPAHHRGDAGAVRGGAALARAARRRGHGLEHGLEDQPVGAPARRRARVPAAVAAADVRRHRRHELSRRGRRLRQPVRRPPAVPDRRQLRRHRRRRRDAGAEPRRRDPPAAGAALGVAERPRARHPPARRLRGRPRRGQAAR